MQQRRLIDLRGRQLQTHPRTGRPTHGFSDPATVRALIDGDSGGPPVTVPIRCAPHRLSLPGSLLQRALAVCGVGFYRGAPAGERPGTTWAWPGAGSTPEFGSGSLLRMLTLAKMADYEACREAFRLDVPASFNFGFDVVAERARVADKTAVVAVDRTVRHVERLSYSDLDRRSNRVASTLLALGARKGDYALVMVPRGPVFFDVVIGCIKSGIVAMPGTNLLTAKDVAYRVKHAGARIAVVSADNAAKVEAVRASCSSLELLLVLGDERPGWVRLDAACRAAADTLERAQVPLTAATEPMLAFFTSGTTGPPKMVPHSHAYAAAHLITGRYWMDLEPGDLHWTLSDTGWAKAAWGVLFGPLMVGAASVVYDAGTRFDPETHLELIGRLGVTTFCAPPTAYRMFAQMELGGYEFSTLRHAMSAGEPLNPEVMRIWKAATGVDVYDGYGQTESVCLVANYPALPIRPGSMGRPAPGLDVDVVDEAGTAVADGEVGEIAVRVGEPWPPGLFRGYWRDEAATRRCFRGDWYLTGDTATRDADGYLWFVGRHDDVITSAGYRIGPFEVESALLEHPAVAEAAVVGKPDALRGEIVKAYVVLAKGHEPSGALAGALQAFVKSQTAPYKYPREVAFVDELPKTVSGKIRRVALRAAARAES